MIDLHSHIIPGIDDGVRSPAEARQLARLALAEGIHTMAATPHVRSDYPSSASRIKEEVERLRGDFAHEEIPVRIVSGAEVDLAFGWQLALEELQALALGGKRYLLVEFPYRGWPPDLLAAVERLRRGDLVPVLAHPERNPEVQDRLMRLEETVAAGALVQVTAGSLVGEFGVAARAAAERLIELGLAHLLASDSHGPGRRGLAMRSARRIVGPALGSYFTEHVPEAILAGRDLPPPPSTGG